MLLSMIVAENYIPERNVDQKRGEVLRISVLVVVCLGWMHNMRPSLSQGRCRNEAHCF